MVRKLNSPVVAFPPISLLTVPGQVSFTPVGRPLTTIPIWTLLLAPYFTLADAGLSIEIPVPTVMYCAKAPENPSVIVRVGLLALRQDELPVAFVLRLIDLLTVATRTTETLTKVLAVD